jgi:enoyl-CoA hydratase/carnithine racemase
MSYRFLTVNHADAVAVLTLNRPKANALSLELVSEIGNAVAELERSNATRCIVVTGGDGRFFSGGADIPALRDTLENPFATGSTLSAGLETMDRIEMCTKPVVAAVNGIAVGGGCELALACHVRIASDAAQFGQPEINLGIVPGWGGCHRLPRLIGESRALEWLLTGRMVDAREALEAGLVCKVVPAAELMPAAKELAGELASKPPVAVRAILRAVRERALHPENGKAYEAEAFSEVAASADAAEGLTAFVEKRPARFSGN